MEEQNKQSMEKQDKQNTGAQNHLNNSDNNSSNKLNNNSNIQEQEKQEYAQYIKEVTPKNNLWVQMAKAFFVGGVICVIGQFILNTAQNQFGLDKDTAGSWCAMLLVLTSAILTGFNLYQKLVKFGGAGALVPITGFANSVSAAAIEFKKEGQVYGIGCKIFIIAGPVILYGIFTSWVLGLIYWIGGLVGVI